MCGICGAVSVDGAPAPQDAVRRMRAALAHRGPDDEGEFAGGGAAFGFRRLSILDLERGHQPMSSDDGRLTIVFNGEIYNHPELRRELEAAGAKFKTRADTETILRLYERQGPGAFKRLVGMFAVGVWDSAKQELTLARDPIGIKPLYYNFDGKRLLFSSELRSLLAGGVSTALDHAGALDYLSFGKVHAPRTILRDVLKLSPGHFLRLDASGLRLTRFWKVPDEGGRRPETLGQAEDTLDRLLSESVRGAMLSDVPVGAFLSGGVDSSLVAAYMTRHAGGRKVQTFSVGFEGAASGVDESGFAREAAAHLGTEHHELMLPARVLDRLEESVAFLDEPIADSAILPTFLLSQFARKTVKVALTGEGADELFAGYNRYKAAWLNERLRRLPGWTRGPASALARRLGKGEVFSRLPYDSAHQWARATAEAQPEDLQGLLHPDFWQASRRGDPLDWLKDFDGMGRLRDALVFDLRTVLCDSLLMKVDKSTMRASLEARVPFLNVPVVEYALGLPADFKIRHFKGKYLLRRVAARYLPSSIVWRRKHGFIVPWEAWVRAPRNPVLDALVEDRTLAQAGLFDMERLKFMRRELAAGAPIDSGLFFRAAILGLWLQSLARNSTMTAP